MKNYIFVLVTFLFFCCSESDVQDCSKVDVIDLTTIKLEAETKITFLKEGCYCIDSNSVLPRHESTLMEENIYMKELIESSSSFNLKSEWKKGNDSPSNGICLNYSSDTSAGAYFINTTEGHIAIYGANNESIKDGIKMFEALFLPEFKEKEIRDKWYIPRVIIEHTP